MMSRDTTASRAASNTPDDLRQWIQDPGYIKRGAQERSSQRTWGLSVKVQKTRAPECQSNR